MKVITTVLTVFLLLFTLNVVVMAQSETTEKGADDPYFHDFATAQEAAAKEGKPVYVDFYTDW